MRPESAPRLTPEKSHRRWRRPLIALALAASLVSGCGQLKHLLPQPSPSLSVRECGVPGANGSFAPEQQQCLLERQSPAP